MSKKFSLSSLLNQKSLDEKVENAEEETNEKDFDIKKIDIKYLLPDERNFYSIADIEELQDSISMFGLQQNLVVRPDGSGYFKVVSGHRRLKALRNLIVDEISDAKFRLVPCKVETKLDGIKAELQLIHANSTTRVLTDFEKMRQATRLKELLVELKKQGVEIPGRLRDAVADTLETSATQVQRFESIDNNLTDEFKEEFENENINISTAYELSKLDEVDQQDLFEEYEEKESLTIADVKERKEQIQKEQPKKEIKQEQRPKVAEVITKKVYICSPFSWTSEEYNNVIEHSRYVMDQGHIPFSAESMLYGVVKEGTDVTKAIKAAHTIIEQMNEVWVFNEVITDHMELIIEEAKQHAIPIINVHMGLLDKEAREQVMEVVWVRTDDYTKEYLNSLPDKDLLAIYDQVKELIE